MELEDYCELYLSILQEGLSRRETVKRRLDFEQKYTNALRKKLSPISQADTTWLEVALRDEQKKKFILYIFYGLNFPLPKKLFKAMIRAAVYEVNPSTNQYFIIPCLKAYGARIVNIALLEYVENGDDFEKAGAVNALYWASSQLEFRGEPPKYSIEYATPESIQEINNFRDVWIKKQSLYLIEFVKNPNVSVRRSLIAHLYLNDPLSYPEEIRPLVSEAVTIARNHSDEYIRQRVEIQLHTKNKGEPSITFMALPDRKE